MTTHARVPEWLALWRERTGVSAPAQGVSAPTQAVAAPSTPKRRARGTDDLGFVEPRQWPWDGGTRREPVLDTDQNPPRVVRHVGWRSCMRCRYPFFSQDVTRMRICDPCKQVI